MDGRIAAETGQPAGTRRSCRLLGRRLPEDAKNSSAASPSAPSARSGPSSTGWYRRPTSASSTWPGRGSGIGSSGSSRSPGRRPPSSRPSIATSGWCCGRSSASDPRPRRLACALALVLPPGGGPGGQRLHLLPGSGAGAGGGAARRPPATAGPAHPDRGDLAGAGRRRGVASSASRRRRGRPSVRCSCRADPVRRAPPRRLRAASSGPSPTSTSLERGEREAAIARFEEFLVRYPDDPQVHARRHVPARRALLREGRGRLPAGQRRVPRAGSGAPPAEGGDPPPEPMQELRPVHRPLPARSSPASPTTGFTPRRPLPARATAWARWARATEAQAPTGLIERYPHSPFVPEAWVRLGDWYFDDVRDRLAAAGGRGLLQDVRLARPPAVRPGHLQAGLDLLPDGRLRGRGGVVHPPARLLRGPGREGRRAAGRATSGPRPSSTPPSASPTGAGAAWRRPGPSSPGWAGAPTRRRSSAGSATSISTRPGSPRRSTPTRLVLAREPLSPDAPQGPGQDRPGLAARPALDRRRRRARRWWPPSRQGRRGGRSNRGDPDLVPAVRDLVEKSLIGAATFHHAQAQQLKQAGKLARPRWTSTAAAAMAYGDDLRASRTRRARTSWPTSTPTASTTPSTSRRPPAPTPTVRDDPADNKYSPRRRSSAVISLGGEVTRQTRAGQLAERKPLRSTERQEAEEVKAEPLPAVLPEPGARVGRLRGPKMPRRRPVAPPSPTRRASSSTRTTSSTEARCRFEEVVGRFPATRRAQFSANLIIESYLTVKDWAAVEEASARLHAYQWRRARPSPGLAAEVQAGRTLQPRHAAHGAEAVRGGRPALHRARHRGPQARVRGQGPLQRRHLLRERPAVRVARCACTSGSAPSTRRPTLADDGALPRRL